MRDIQYYEISSLGRFQHYDSLGSCLALRENNRSKLRLEAFGCEELISELTGNFNTPWRLRLRAHYDASLRSGFATAELQGVC
jgi:hypothetical protein